MVESSALKCGPLRPVIPQTKLSFGRDNSRQATDDIQPADSFEKKVGCACEGAGCEACQPKANAEAAAPKARKINFKKAKERFLEGVMSPVETILDKPVTSGTIVVGGFVLSKFVEANRLTKIAKYGILASAGVAVYNLGKGLVDFATAKTPEGKEDSFYDIGQGAVYGALAVLPAPKVAASENLVPAETNYYNSFKACVLSVPDDIKFISSALKDFFRTGNFSNLKAAFGPSASSATVAGTEAVHGSADVGLEVPEVGGSDGPSKPAGASVIDSVNLDDVVGSPEKADMLRRAAGIAKDQPFTGAGLAASDNENQLAATG